MVRALERGLSLSDFNDMTFGMIIDYIIVYNNSATNERAEEIKDATQEDFDSF